MLDRHCSDNRPMKLLIVDDHAVVRAGLAALLGQIEPGTSVLQAGDGAEGLALAAEHGDLAAVFLDLNLPGLSGGEAIRAFHAQSPQVPVIVLSSSEDPEDVRRSLAAGALGYVPKSARPQTLASALRLVLAGDVYVPPLILDTAVKPAARTPAADPVSQLTPRQVEVLARLGRGLSNGEIGRELGLSENTVKVHVASLFKALNVVNRLQAAEIAKTAKLI